MTCHVAQGATVDRAFVLADGRLCREWGYTALTRGREANHLHFACDRETGRDEFAPRGLRLVEDPLAQLTTALERSDAESLALDRGRPIRPLEREAHRHGRRL